MVPLKILLILKDYWLHSHFILRRSILTIIFFIVQSTKKCPDSCFINLSTRYFIAREIARSKCDVLEMYLFNAGMNTHMYFDADVGPAEVLCGESGVVPDDDDRVKVWQTLETRHSVQ